MVKLSIHPSAQREYREAAAWYRQRDKVAARRFVAEVKKVLHRIEAHPEWYGRYDDLVREGLLKRFPFGIVYQILASGNVLVVAVAHSSRDAGYWRHRITS